MTATPQGVQILASSNSQQGILKLAAMVRQCRLTQNVVTGVMTKQLMPLPNKSREHWQDPQAGRSRTKRSADRCTARVQPHDRGSQTGRSVIGATDARVIWRFTKCCPQATIFRVTKERWAQIGITTEFLIVVRTLGEFFRLRHLHGTNFSTPVAAVYVAGALIAACSCWAGVTFYFFRRYVLSAWITLATVPVLLIYKVAVIGW